MNESQASRSWNAGSVGGCQEIHWQKLAEKFALVLPQPAPVRENLAYDKYCTIPMRHSRYLRTYVSNKIVLGV